MCVYNERETFNTLGFACKISPKNNYDLFEDQFLLQIFKIKDSYFYSYKFITEIFET